MTSSTRALSRRMGHRAILAVVTVAVFGNILVLTNRAAAAGTPLLAIGLDSTAGSKSTATYTITVRNAGTSEATNVRVALPVPVGTTFESSTPAASPVAGSAPGSPPTCDNAGTREPENTNCQWALGSVAANSTKTIQVLINLLPTATGVEARATVTGRDPASGAAMSREDMDSALKRATLTTFGGTSPAIAQDTFVDRNEPTNTNHGTCAVLTASGDGAKTAYLDLPPSSTSNPNSLAGGLPNVDRVLFAELQAKVTAPDYTPQSPGTLALHAITSGDWTEGNGGCAAGTLGSGSEVRTGTVPSSKTTPTATQSVTGSGDIAWDVTADVDGAQERAAFQGWEIKNPTGQGSADIASKSDAALAPKLVVVYTQTETVRCIDVDPDFEVDFPSSERIITATVMKSSLAANNTRITGSSRDACNGTPISGHRVYWQVDDDSPDVHVSKQDGTPIAPTGTGDVGPDAAQTTTNDEGQTSIGIRLANPAVWSGENRVAGCLILSGTPTATDNCSGGTPAAAGEPSSSAECTISPSLPTCTATGENTVEDDANLQWSPSGAPPEPSQTPTDTASPTSSPSTTSPSPSPTGSTSPSPSVSPSTSTSPTPTASPTPLSNVTVALASSTVESIAGQEVVLNGTVNSDLSECAQPGATVEILERGAEATSPKHLAYASTGVGGLFEHRITPDANTIYTAEIEAHDLCLAAESEPVTILVAPEVTIRSTANVVEKGRRFWITGTVLPEHQLTQVTLWRKVGPDEFKQIGEDYLDDASRYAFSIKYRWKQKRVRLIARWESTDADHISGESSLLRVKRALDDAKKR